MIHELQVFRMVWIVCVDTKRKTVIIIISPNISSRLKWPYPVKLLIATNYSEYMRQNDLDN